MCMWFGFNSAVNFCHFSTLLTLSFFAGVTSTSPKFDLFFYIFYDHREYDEIGKDRKIDVFFCSTFHSTNLLTLNI